MDEEKKKKKQKLPAIHIIRRQSARILKTVLQGSAQRRAIASVKTLVYKPSVVSKKATYALVCRTLKYLPVIKEVLDSANFVNKKLKGQLELFYVLTHDLLFEQEVLPSGEAEKLLLSRKSAVRAALVRLLLKKNATEIDGLLPQKDQSDATEFPRYVRVNTLKMSVGSAMERLEEFGAKIDELLPDVLVLPGGTDLHDHPLVLQGNIFLQGKSSCIPAHALQPQPDWEVLDACAAPGNKTVHLAALMNGQGRVTACELHEKRLKVLQSTVERAGANNVEVILQDFLRIDPTSPKYCKIRGLLLDPSCSGSGTRAQRLDHLLPPVKDDPKLEAKRIERLASFQKAALGHALTFPGLERLVYSTCSVHQGENEDVVQAVLKLAESLNFELETVLPLWRHRGLPVFEGAHHLLRMDPSRDGTDGFFVALFIRRENETRNGTKSFGTGNKKRRPVDNINKKSKKKKS